MNFPRFAFAHAELAIAAAYLRDQRAAGDPPMVETGKLTASQAADRLRVATSVAADWHAYAARKLPEPDGTGNAEKLAMLEQAFAATAGRAERTRAAIGAAAPWMAPLSRGELIAIADMEFLDPRAVAAVREWLHWETYAADIEALLWWQRRTGEQSIRTLILISQAMRDATARKAAA